MERWEQMIAGLPLPAANQKVYIWGAGNTSVLNHQGMLREKLYEELRLTAFLDRNNAGTVLNGFPVLSPEILEQQNPEDVYVLISTANSWVYSEIARLCREKKIQSCFLDAVLLKLRKEQFLKTAELLDEDSKKLYHKLIEYRISFHEDYSDVYAGDSYFGIPAFCKSDHRDVIVDCGAYVGDSAERYLWRMEQFKKYIAIEPDEANFRAMTKRFQRLNEEWNLPCGKLVAVLGGTDAYSHRIRMETRVGGLGSIARDDAGADAEEIKFWAIDVLMPEGFTFLKADIESYEYRMLQGARNSITKYHPRMAICIYHNMLDMFGIAQLIHEIDPAYRLSVRHHSYGFEETVLYAY